MISVVIPLYNKEKSISNTINSVLKQDFSDFEVVIVDDGSTDGSVSIVESINDPHVRLIKQENGGPSKARNTGINKANGAWVVLLDADDELLPESLSTFAQLISEHPDVDIIDCNTMYYHTKGNILGNHPIEGYIKNPMKMFFYSLIGPGANHSCFKKELLRKYPYNVHIRRFEDGELLMRLLPNAKVYSSSKPVSLVHGEFACASRPRKNPLEDYFAYLDFSRGGFWQKMCTYKMFLENRELYPEYGKKHYAKMYKRYDWLLMYKLLNWVGKFLNK